MSSNKEKAQAWLACPYWCDVLSLAALLDETAREAVTAYQQQVATAHNVLETNDKNVEPKPQPQWKPGQMLVGRDGSIHRLLYREPPCHWNHQVWEHSKWSEPVGPFGGFYHGYEPYPRVGDWVRRVDPIMHYHLPAVFQITKITTDSALGVQGQYCLLTDIEPSPTPWRRN